jgi:hypothetical protein
MNGEDKLRQYQQQPSPERTQTDASLRIERKKSTTRSA